MSFFKKKLYDLYLKGIGRNKRDHNETDYDMMIRYGAMGEITEDYYLFIYRDLYRTPAYYGAVLFINKRDRQGRMVTVHCFEENGEERERELYIYAAIYFLQGDYQNLLNINDRVQFVFDMAKERLSSFFKEKTPVQNRGPEVFPYQIKNQQIDVSEVVFNHNEDHLQNTNTISPFLKPPEMYDSVKGKNPDNLLSFTPAIGVKLAGSGQLLEEKTIQFFPIFFINGKRASTELLFHDHSDLNFDFSEQYKILTPYCQLYKSLIENKIAENKLLSVLNQCYFSGVGALLKSNSELTLYLENDRQKREDVPIDRTEFSKIRVQFAPSIEDRATVSIFITLWDLNENAYEAKNEYFVRIENGSAFLLITRHLNECLAWQEINDKEMAFFRFLQTYKKVKRSEFSSLAAYLAPFSDSERIEIDTTLLKKYELRYLPVPVLKILNSSKRRGETLELNFDYDRPLHSFLLTNPDKSHYQVVKNYQFEKDCLELLRRDEMLNQELSMNSSDRRIASSFKFAENDSRQWLGTKGSLYLGYGFLIYSEKYKKYIGNVGAEFRIKINKKNQWLEFSPELTDLASGEGIGVDTIVDRGNGWISDRNGSLHIINKDEIDRLSQLLRYGEKVQGRYRIPENNFVLINKLYDKRNSEIENIDDIIEKNRLIKMEKIRPYEQSGEFNGDLRVYQKAGFDWMNFLHEYGFSGCLADDMGLGKTVQTIALLEHLLVKKQLKTSILIVPVSAILNWENEIRRFSGTLNYLRYSGTARVKETMNWHRYDLIITSYATLRNDISFVSQFEFDYIILDESQYIKNHQSQVSKAVKLLKGNHRLALSGTPIENNSLELWSLFDYLMPGYLGTLNWFKHTFTKNIENGDASPENDSVEMLKKMVFPFLLRRRKEDVERELPPKTDIVVKLKMGEAQADVYQETARYYRNELSGILRKKSRDGATSMKILEGILRLRQICLFPRLVDTKWGDIESIKYEFFLQSLDEILAEGHKVLVFSQFVQVLEQLASGLEKRGVLYTSFDGRSTIKKREKAIEQFQKGNDTNVFLLSLKAGGVALNLTEADYVIIFDPWWNPAVEEQASARAYRIGQKRNVFVYKYVIEGSIEEKMLELQNRKKALFESIVTTDSSSFKDLSGKEILALFE